MTDETRDYLIRLAAVAALVTLQAFLYDEGLKIALRGRWARLRASWRAVGAAYDVGADFITPTQAAEVHDAARAITKEGQ